MLGRLKCGKSREEQVDIKILSADLEMMLAGDERKPFSQFEQQVFDPVDEGPFDVALVSGRA
jgi:hypothetical protein